MRKSRWLCCTFESLRPTRSFLPILVALILTAAVEVARAETLLSVSPMGASTSVSISITGTGFSASASSNDVTFTPVSGTPVTVTAATVTTVSAATGLRRLTVVVPNGLPIGTAALSVLNKQTGEVSTGKSLEVIAIDLPDRASAALGTNNLNVRVTGSPNTAFIAGATRATFGPGITVNTTTVQSATSLIANISVSATATVGTRAVGVVTNTQTAQRIGAFSLTETPVNHPPIWSPLDNQTLNVGAARDLSLVATDPDGDALTLTVSPLPAFAGFVDLGNGTGTLSLDAGQAQPATYSLTATATDSKGASASFVLTVTVVAANQRPTVTSQQLTVAEDKPLPLVLSGADPEGAPVTFSVVVSPAHGTLSGTAPALVYTPAADYYGPDQFQFVASDGTLSSDPATVAITVTEVNDSPVLGPDAFTLKYAGTLPNVPPAPGCGMPCGVIYGDPHVMSYDQALFDAQAVGEIVATKSTTDDFEVQARFAPVPGLRTVSIAVAVAMRVAGHRVAIYRTAAAKGYIVRIDGNPTTISAAPQALPGGGAIGTYSTDDSAIVTWPDGTVAIVKAVGIYPAYYRFLVEIGLAPGRLGRVVGLLGDADRNNTNDLVTRGGQSITFPNPPFATFYGTYMNSWRVNMAETLFDYDAGQSTDTFTDLTFPDMPATPQTLPAAALSRATALCGQFGLAAGAATDACLVDVGITGDADFATEGATAQSANRGVTNNAGATLVGTPTTVTIDTPGAMAVRTFPGIAGQKLTLSISGNTITTSDVTVRDPNGNAVAALAVSSATAFHEPFTLPTSGTFVLTVDPREQFVGSLTFSLAEVPNNAGTIAIGSSTTVAIGTIGEVAVRSFTATAGQKLTLTATDNSIPVADITVRGPSGNTVAALVVSSPTGFLDVFTLPTTGTYTISVDPRDQQIGTLTITLNAVPDDAGTTTIGTPTTVTIGTVGEVATRTFSATAGQKLTLTVTGNSIPGADITVRAPSGTSVTSLFVSGATAFRDVFTLPATGTYTITVDPRDLLTGSLTFTLNTVPDDAGTTTIGTPTTVTIGTVGEVAARTFTATAGQKLTLTVSGNSIPGADITVRAPSGTSVTSLFVSGATAFRDVFTLPTTGTYTITVDPRDLLTGSLTYTLNAVPDNTGSTGIGTPTLVAIGTIGEVAMRTFTATAGQKLTLNVTGNSIPGVDITVRAPSGTSVASLFVSGATAFRDVFTLPTTGTYTIAVDPRDLLTGSLTFTMNAVPDNTGSTAIGTPTTVVIGTIGEVAIRTFTATAGQMLTLNVTGNTIAGADITVRAPSGTSVTSLFASGATAFRDVFTLPTTGTYTITVDPRDLLTGSLTYTMNVVPDNTGSTAIGTPTTVTIGTIGEVAIRTFTATAGQKLTLNVTGNSIPGADISVRAPSGTSVASLFVSGAAAFLDVFTLPTTGTYAITVDPRDLLTGSLTYTMNAVPDNTGSTAIGTPTTVTIGTIGEVAIRTFSATAGQSVSLSVSGNTIAGVDLTVRSPSGATVATLFASAATATRSAFTLAVTGTYTITIDPRLQLVGELTFTVVPN